MSKGIVFVSYGLFGAGVEWWQTGLRLLVSRLKKADYETMGSPYSWNDVNAIVSEIYQAGPSIPIAVIGASLGANEAVDIASRVKRHIHYLGGFQTSLHGYRTGVPANVGHADNIYNPGIIGWLRTFGGLGSAKWYPAKGNTQTVIRNIPIYESHPDDWGIAQDIIFSRTQSLIP